MDANKTWEMTQAMMTGDFNPNHGDDGRFTSGSGGSGSLKPTNGGGTSPFDHAAEKFIEEATGEVHGWTKNGERVVIKPAKMKDPAGHFKRAASMSGLKPILDQMDKESKDNVSKAVYRAAASPDGRDATLRFGHKSIKVTTPSKDKHVAKQYGITWTGKNGTPMASYHGTTSDLATHLLITMKDLGYKGEKITLDAAPSAWEVTERMMVGDFNPYHDEDGRFTSGGGSDYDDDYDDDEDDGDVSTLRSMTEGNF